MSFDLDVLDRALRRPSSTWSSEEGMTMKEALSTLQGLRGLDLGGSDLVCLMPTKDSPKQITVGNGAAILFELISLMADRLGDVGSRSRTA